jgi:hypothetical protein
LCVQKAAFALIFFYQKKYKAKLQLEKNCAKHFCTEKASHKMLVKMTPASKRNGRGSQMDDWNQRRDIL